MCPSPAPSQVSWSLTRRWFWAGCSWSAGIGPVSSLDWTQSRLDPVWTAVWRRTGLGFRDGRLEDWIWPDSDWDREESFVRWARVVHVWKIEKWKSTCYNKRQRKKNFISRTIKSEVPNIILMRCCGFHGLIWPMDWERDGYILHEGAWFVKYSPLIYTSPIRVSFPPAPDWLWCDLAPRVGPPNPGWIHLSRSYALLTWLEMVGGLRIDAIRLEVAHYASRVFWCQHWKVFFCLAWRFRLIDIVHGGNRKYFTSANP